MVSALTTSGISNPDDNSAQAGHIVTHTHTFQKVIRSGARDVNGDLPPEVWAERDIAATLNLNDLASTSRAVELVVQAHGYQESPDVAHCLRAAPSKADKPDSTTYVTITGQRTHALTAEGADASEDGTGRGTPIIAFQPQAAGDSALSIDITSPCLSGSQLAAIQSDTTVRRLTPRECERLQGFPDDWTSTSNGKDQADGPRYRQMGNSVAVPCVEWTMRRIVEVDAR